MQKDVEEVVLDARKLNEEVERLRREMEAKERVAQAKSRQCEMLSKRLSALTTELEEAKAAAHGKHRLLEAKEQECSKLANVVQDLQRKLEVEVKVANFFLNALFLPMFSLRWTHGPICFQVDEKLHSGWTAARVGNEYWVVCKVTYGLVFWHQARDNEWLLMALLAVSGKGQEKPREEDEYETFYETG
jgi:predicted Holliday junction resolvase-like endonuclease